MKIKAVVVYGFVNVKKFFEMVKNGEKEYYFIEIMVCSGGCIMGGGQLIVFVKVKEKIDVVKFRVSVIYDEDRFLLIRKFYENFVVKRLYEEFLGYLNSEKVYYILYIYYKKRLLY